MKFFYLTLILFILLSMFLFPLTDTDYSRPVKQKRIFEDSEPYFMK